MPRPDFFIVGAPKSGTTAMNVYLSEHPDIFMAKKERHYFGRDLIYVDGAPGAPSRDEQVYLSYFDGWHGEARIGEASVWYLFSRTAAEEIKDFSPEAQIIIMLRNPIEMMYSNYFELLVGACEDLPTFEAALEAEQDRREGRKIPPSAPSISALFYRDSAKYTEQVQRYFDVFGCNRVHVIIFDDFRENTAREYAHTLEFLGVDPTYQANLRVINSATTARNKKLNLMLRHPDGTFWYKRMRMMIPRFIRTPISKKLHEWLIVPLQKPPMNSELHRELQQEFLPEIEQLSELLVRDLTYWCRNEME